MKKVLTPSEAYKIVEKLAKKEGVATSRYVMNRGMDRASVSKWRKKESGTITLEMAQRLGIV